MYLGRALTAHRDFTPLVALPKGAPLADLCREQGVRTIPLPTASDLSPWNILALRRIVTNFKPDVVHTNDAHGASLAALLKLLGTPFKLVHSRRVSYPLGTGWSLKKYTLADAVVGVSREITEIMARCGVPEPKLRAIHSGIDISLYDPSKTGGTLTIGAVGALTPQKGFEVLLNGLAELRKMNGLPDWRCLLAGDGPLRNQLESQSRTLGLDDVVSFLGYQDSRSVLPDMDVLAVPSVDGEGSSGVIKEGWASATPVVCSDLPSNLELVIDRQNGLVFANNDACGLAERLAALLTDAEERHRLALAGRETVAEFTDTVMAGSYMALYRELLK